MKKLINTLSLMLLSINIVETSPIVTKNALALIKTHSPKAIRSTALILKEKIIQNIPQDLSPKTIDSKKALLFGAASSIDPVFALGSALGISIGAISNQILINLVTQPKPEDKAIQNLENIKKNGFKSYEYAIKNPFQTFDKVAKSYAETIEKEKSITTENISKAPSKAELNQIKLLIKNLLLFYTPTYITLEALINILGASMLDGSLFGLSTVLTYSFSKTRSYMKSAEQKEFQEPANLAQLSEEFNKMDTLLENDSSNTLNEVKNQEQK